MAWYDKALKMIEKVAGPQFFSDEANDWVISKGDADGSLFVKVKNNVVEDYWEGNSNTTKTYQTNMNGISISNDGVEKLTFSINGITRTVYAGEVYTAQFKQPFTSVSVTATDLYRVEVLS